MTALSAEDTAALHAQATHATGPIPVNPSVLLALLEAPAEVHRMRKTWSEIGDLCPQCGTVNRNLADLRDRIERVLSQAMGGWHATRQYVWADNLRAALDPKARP